MGSHGRLLLALSSTTVHAAACCARAHPHVPCCPAHAVPQLFGHGAANVQVIELTRDLCQSEAADAAAPGQGQAAGERAQHQQLAGPASAAPAAAGAAPPSVSSLLPPQVAEQIRHAQQRAALAGQGPAEWAIGAKCRAVYSEDGNWCVGWLAACARRAQAAGGLLCRTVPASWSVVLCLFCARASVVPQVRQLTAWPRCVQVQCRGAGRGRQRRLCGAV